MAFTLMHNILFFFDENSNFITMNEDVILYISLITLRATFLQYNFLVAMVLRELRLKQPSEAFY